MSKSPTRKQMRDARKPNNHKESIAVLRISKSEAGDTEAIDRQRVWCEARAALDERPITLEFVDNGIGASKYSKAGDRRANFDALLEAIETNKYGAVYATETSRIIRSVPHFREVLDACSATGTALVLKDGIGYVPGDRMSKFMCEVVAGLAELETDLMVERMQFANDARRERGLPIARTRAFGWTDTSRKHENKLEATAVRMVVDGLLNYGASLADSCRYLNDRELYGVQGKPWQVTTLRNYLLNPALAGWCTTTGDNGRAIKVKMPEREEDAWQAIITENQHARLVALFNGRKRSRPAVAYPLTGLLFDTQDLPMTANKAEGKRRYRTDARARAKNGGGKCIAIYADVVEQAVLNSVVAELRKTSLSEWLDDVPGAAAWDAARVALQSAEQNLVELTAMKLRKECDEQTYNLTRPQFLSERDKAAAAATEAYNSLRSQSVLKQYESTEALAAKLPTMDADDLHAVLADMISKVVVGMPDSMRADDYNSPKRVVRIEWRNQSATEEAA